MIIVNMHAVIRQNPVFLIPMFSFLLQVRGDRLLITVLHMTGKALYLI